MARVKDVEIDEVPPDVKPIYQRYVEEYGPFANQAKVFAHRPIALKHIMGMLLEMADNPILERRHLEIAIVAVSAVNSCDYCVAHHGPKLEASGLPRDTVDNILNLNCPGLTPLELLIRDYAVQVTKDHNRVSDTQFDGLRAVSYTHLTLPTKRIV